MQKVHGLTWDHPRGTDALRAAADQARAKGLIDIQWDAQSLEGFEAHPIEDLAERYDLIVLDHPHLGDAYAGDCLQSLNPIFADQLPTWREVSVGPSFDSYTYKGEQWALPLDTATHVMIRGGDVLHQPSTAEELIGLTTEIRVVPCLAGPHAALMFMALCAGLGRPCDTGKKTTFFADPTTGVEAIQFMAELSKNMSDTEWGMNPIAIHEAVAAEEIDLCPWVYGYAPYGRSGAGQVLFSDVVRFASGARLGSVLGGTGLAISKRISVTPALKNHIEWLMSLEVQTGLIPQNSGQPSSEIAWQDAGVNGAVGGFYTNTRATTEAAWVRPRWPGYTRFQGEMSEILRDGLRGGTAASAILSRCEALHQATLGVAA